VELKTFGRTGLGITPIGFGAWAIGGGNWEFGWGPQEESQALAAIDAALERGMNWIDTAAVYGLGRSEEIVGRALRGVNPRPLVFTKCSMTWGADRRIRRSLKADSVRRECEASLRRLGLDTIDLYQIHWPNPEPEIEEGWEEMARLKADGLVRHIGVSNFSVPQLRRLEPIAPVESLQPPYSLLNRGIEKEILPYCRENGIGVIIYSPMVSGLLTGAMTRERIAGFPPDDWRRHSPNFQEPLLSRNLALAQRLKEIGTPHGRSAGEVAVAWTLRHPAVTAAIVGGRSRRQVEEMAGAAEFRLSPEQIAGAESGL